MADPSDHGPSPTSRRTDTDDPRRARERALKILFQADVRETQPDQMLAALDADEDAVTMLDDVDELTDEAATASGTARPVRGRAGVAPLDGFTRRLVLGVGAHRESIDALISRYARRWQISRMPVVDRTVLRLATYELLHEPTPPAVVIDEAVGMAKALSTDDSGRYVNGVLESIRKEVASGGSQRPTG